MVVLAIPVRGQQPRASQQAVSENQDKGETVAAHLSNKDIADMLRAGLSPEIVLAKIKTSVCDFDTSPSALQELKAAGVPDAVILAMVGVPRRGTTPGDTTPVSRSSPPIQPPQFVEVKVPDGTPVEVQLSATVSSEDVEEGSIVDFTVVQPVKVSDYVVIERGAPAKARIEQVKKARHWGRAGKIAWAMQDAVASDGTRIPLRFTKESEGGGSSGKVAGAVIATSLVFWPAAPVWGLKKGKPAVMPAGKRFDVFVHGETAVKARPGAKLASPTPEKEK
jgi:hypothetical protein